MLDLNKDNFKYHFERVLFETSGKYLSTADEYEIYLSLGKLLKEILGEQWAKSINRQNSQKVKKMYYLSMEYLTGPFTKQYLKYLDLYSVIKEGFDQLGISLDDIIDYEKEPALGNGGLGRLAAAFLDSLSSLKLPGHGYGLRYEKGLFKQEIHNGLQVEKPEDWLAQENIWEYKRDNIFYEVKIGGQVDIDKEGEDLTFAHRDYESIKAIAYDIPILGYKNQWVNTLRLWEAKSGEDIDLSAFSRGDYSSAFNKINSAQAITQFLYPNDSHWEGKKLRLKQEYFLVSASLQDIYHKFKDLKVPIEKFSEYITIHINDTHPTLAIPELMRILLDEEGLKWDKAWDIVIKTFAFTNHTILNEAMEKWDINLYKEILPRIYLITVEINHRFIHELREEHGISTPEQLSQYSIVEDNMVKMLNLSIVGSYSINGVAQLHSSILKERELNHFYRIYPKKFNNKTNGIVHRKWLLDANPQLTDLIQIYIGPEFIKNPIALEKLLDYRNDKSLLNQLYSIKHENKVRLAHKIYKEQGIILNPHSIFDIHIKRIHEYKRQLLNILHIIYLYNSLKENANLDITPRTFFFAGKAAPGYYIAKEIIALINIVANMVNNDLAIKDKLKVVFVENYNVSRAMELIPGADVSEQISTTTKEASGTGNMKFMMNGAITLATLDGANVEIAQQVGQENIIIFGLKDYEVYDFYNNYNYNSEKLYNENPIIKSTLNSLIDGRINRGGGDFRNIFDLLIKHNDHYFILKDFEDYRRAQEKIGNLYRNKMKWQDMSLVNIAKSGYFSSDNTIKKYAEEIWNIQPL